MSDSEGQHVLELRGVAKRFGGNFVLRGVDLTLRSGRILALAGENGAGKSTIVKLISGIHQPDEGALYLGSERIELTSPRQASSLGIRVVHQEPALFPDLDVAENVFLGHQPRDRFGGIDWRETYRRTTEVMSGLLNLDIDPHAPVASLSIAERQVVEIAKALTLEARVLILDEPTAALTAGEAAELFAVVERLRDQGVAILFVGHRLDEIRAHADELAVLRDGKLVATASPREMTRSEMITHMVGRALDDLFPKVETEIGDVVLRVEGLSRRGVLDDVTLDVRRGEIVGLAGLVGAGRSEVARAVFGIDPVDSGTVTIDGERFVRRSPQRAMARGLALVPEDRQHEGLVLSWPIATNVSLSVLDRLTRVGLISRLRERRLAQKAVSEQSIKATGIDQETRSLSGGNQQKVVLAKWLETGPRVLILDEPTRGVDIQTKAEIHRRISALAAEGIAIILISSELPEVLGMADRIIVMCEGRITGEFSRAEANQEVIMAAATSLADAEVSA